MEPSLLLVYDKRFRPKYHWTGKQYSIRIKIHCIEKIDAKRITWTKICSNCVEEFCVWVDFSFWLIHSVSVWNINNQKIGKYVYMFHRVHFVSLDFGKLVFILLTLYRLACKLQNLRLLTSDQATVWDIFCVKAPNITFTSTISSIIWSNIKLHLMSTCTFPLFICKLYVTLIYSLFTSVFYSRYCPIKQIMV